VRRGGQAYNPAAALHQQGASKASMTSLSPPAPAGQNPSSPVDSRAAWAAAAAALVCLGMSFGAPMVTMVGLKAIAHDMGGERSVPALAGSLAWLGSAVGGIVMGRLAQRFGVRCTVMAGGVSVLLGLYVSTLGQPWQLYVGHGVFIGFLGIAGLNAPLYVYVSHWFERRRGSALALLSSGNYIAGICWPVVFEYTTTHWGWRSTMLGYGALEAVAVLVLAGFFLPPAPEPAVVPQAAGHMARARSSLGLSPNAVFVLIVVAAFLCCVPMAMPQGHLVALCTDRGISAPVGAAMLSVLLGVAFISRQAWGLVADRIGGLRTALISSFMQAVAVSGYLYVEQQFGLFAVSIAFGLGFSALIPAYVLAVREIFPASEAYWRVPIVLLMTGSGMATGGWLAGFLYDRSGSYDPAFGIGVASNVVNLLLLALLVGLMVRGGRRGEPGNGTTQAVAT
jgi:MFS family permease